MRHILRAGLMLLGALAFIVLIESVMNDRYTQQVPAHFTPEQGLLPPGTRTR